MTAPREPRIEPQPDERRASLGPVTLLLTATAGLVAARALMRRPAYDFRGKTVLITGGSRGLGFALARELVGRGARIALCGRDPDALGRARAELERDGAVVLAARADVTDRAQVEALVARVQARLGPIDILVNNAGIVTVGPLTEMTLEDFEEAMRTHFWGPLYTTLAVLPQMRQRGGGRIVNITSIGGKVAVPHLVPYGASKFALVGLSEGLRAELAQSGILVTTVCPGLMRTGSPRHAHFKGRHRDEYTWFALSDALPPLSMSAARAARQIVEACRRGDAEIVLSLPAKIGTTVHALAPGLTAGLLGLINRWLPAPGGIGSQRAAGRESQSRWAPSPLTALDERAARRYNQVD
jgi:NAD(P)-dependent dehydrogenase (short-subunit alcohol dehydrogenase family)